MVPDAELQGFAAGLKDRMESGASLDARHVLEIPKLESLLDQDVIRGLDSYRKVIHMGSRAGIDCSGDELSKKDVETELKGQAY
jgi:hypothetical protein